MKKIIFLLLYIVFPSILFAQTSNLLKNNLEDSSIILDYQFYSYLDKEVQEKIVIELELKLLDNTYTYAPNYKNYPTSFTLFESKSNKTIAYTLYYEEVAKNFDPLTKSVLQLYKDTIIYYLVFDKNIHQIDNTNNARDLKLDLSLLLCSEVNCLPIKKTVDLQIPTDPLMTLSEHEINQNIKKISTLHIASKEISSIVDKNFVLDANLISNTIPQDIVFDFTPVYFNKSLEVDNFSFAILLGFLAGFLLNLMPCVLPVIAIKISSIIQLAQAKQENSDKLIRIHGIFFSLGVLTLFSILAILFGVFDFVWGGIFQNIYFIIFLSGFIFLLGLSFLGFFTFPLINIKSPIHSSKEKPYFDSYFQGLVITLIATPCSGPLLGGVLGFGLTLPLPLLIILFLSTGLGMASPYILMAFFPKTIKYIPKSGAWMGILEQVLAFMLIATSLYLLSFLSQERLFEGILYLFFVALFVWLYTLVKNSKHAKFYAIALFITHTGISTSLLSMDKSGNELDWQEYNYTNFSAALGNKALLVEFTADWCPTCKVIENTVLTHKNIQPLVDEYGLELIKVDITHMDKEKEEFLKSLGSASIPLIALFPPSIFAYQPIVLRDIYTFNQLKSAISENVEKVE